MILNIDGSIIPCGVRAFVSFNFCHEMALATAYEVPRAEPVIIAVADQTPANNSVEHNNDCNCGVPSTASRVVNAVSFGVMGSKPTFGGETK